MCHLPRPVTSTSCCEQGHIQCYGVADIKFQCQVESGDMCTMSSHMCEVCDNDTFRIDTRNDSRLINYVQQDGWKIAGTDQAEELYKSAFRGTSKMLVLLRVSESEGDSSFINKACHPWVTCWIRMRRISDLFL